jgi:hypothetical protein
MTQIKNIDELARQFFGGRDIQHLREYSPVKDIHLREYSPVKNIHIQPVPRTKQRSSMNRHLPSRDIQSKRILSSHSLLFTI